jgi:HEAT repeat protein
LRSWLLLGAACLALSGCALYDDVSSKEWSFTGMFKAAPDPLVVLRDDSDGDHRARAFRALKEPQQYGGTPEQQDVIVRILSEAVANERQPLCRMAAIETLGRFKDPRAVDALKEAYYRAGGFDPDKATVLRCSAIRALGQTHNPAAVELLVRVLREPPAEGPNVDKQQVLDERIAAARALGNFKHYQAAEALVGVLRNDQDVALRARAYDSLEHATGNYQLPADAVAWENYLHQSDQAPAAAPGGGKPFGLIPVAWK